MFFESQVKIPENDVPIYKSNIWEYEVVACPHFMTMKFLLAMRGTTSHASVDLSNKATDPTPRAHCSADPTPLAYNYDRSDHQHNGKEGNWTSNSIPTTTGRSRSQAERPNSKSNRVAASESRADTSTIPSLHNTSRMVHLALLLCHMACMNDDDSQLGEGSPARFQEHSPTYSSPDQPSSPEVQRIQALDLSANGFQGVLPLFGNWKDLTTVNLGFNRLSSTTDLNYQWEGCEILGGRDEIAGGTWLACTKDGRLAFLTIVMESPPFYEAKSRGDLPVRFWKLSVTMNVEMLSTFNEHANVAIYMAQIVWEQGVVINHLESNEYEATPETMELTCPIFLEPGDRGKTNSPSDPTQQKVDILVSAISLTPKPAPSTLSKSFGDIVGKLKAITKIEMVTRRYGDTSQKRDLILENICGSTIKITIWDEMLDEILIDLSHLPSTPVILIVTSTIVDMFKGVCYLKPTCATKMYYNLDIQEVVILLKSEALLKDASVQLMGNATKGTENLSDLLFKNKKELIDIFTIMEESQTQEKHYTCKATITKVFTNYGWYYLSCRKCLKKVIHSNNEYSCNSCQTQIADPIP
ncbi:hypothetical protein GIB67_036370, partial [Kingdonia uniflora]